MKMFNLYLNQFSLAKAIQYGLLALARKIINKNAYFTYSQAGEDIIIQNVFHNHKPGFYIEVGSNDPVHYSNTFGLYCKGWRGITIDANKKMVDKHIKFRPKDIPICAAISDEEKDVTFYEFEMNQISTIDEDFYEYAKNSQVVRQSVMHTRRLDSIISEILGESYVEIDLLSIDVEGHDYQVLNSLNLKVYRPKLIVIEMHNFDILDPLSNAIYAHLTAQNYSFIAYAVWNGYFLANELG